MEVVALEYALRRLEIPLFMDSLEAGLIQDEADAKYPEPPFLKLLNPLNLDAPDLDMFFMEAIEK